MKNFSFDVKGRSVTADDLLIADVLNERYGEGFVKPEVDLEAVRTAIRAGDRTTEFYKAVEAARQRNS
jgi:hypothetical protein